MSSSTIEDLTSLEGLIVSKSFKPGYVVLSYVVSYVGALTTLEIINQRTAMRGYFNWVLLAASSVSMGGIAIWCMHFIGNRALILGNGHSQIQIAYSSGFTALSFFLPVIVLFLAFWAVGSNEQVSIIRVTLGGTLAGFGICGMHYLGQAGITNYDCVYNVAYVVGAGIIAVGASIGALVGFFIFRSAWNTSWWKRAICAIILAGAVSGMHWLAAVGTSYRLRKADSGVASISRTSTVIVVIVLSIAGCFTLLLFTILAQGRIMRAARRAEQVVLAAAIFDSEGRILVTPEGLLPRKKITNTWLERSLDDVFSVSHPVFLWIFRTSRNWSGIANLLPGMRSHINRTGLKGRLGSRKDSKLVNDEGTPISDYAFVFRELFCVAAAELAADLKQPIERVGILYDEIVSTGQPPKAKKGAKKSQATVASSLADLERDGPGHTPAGKGQLLFLVSRAGRREAEHLQAAGFRFASLLNVVPILAQSLHISPRALSQRMEIMRDYSTESNMLDPGVHLACFAIRASVGAGRHGFDVLTRRDAKNLLPTMLLPINTLEDWHLEYLRGMDSMTVAACVKQIHKASKSSNSSLKEQHFAKHLLTTLEALKDEIEDPFFNDALLIAKPVEVPCRGHDENSPPGTAFLITFRIIVPIHCRAPGKKLTFTPLNFFKMQQHVYKNSPDHAVFARTTYREFAPLLDLVRPETSDSRNASRYSLGSTTNMSASRNDVLMGENIDMYGNPISHVPTMHHRGPSKIRFWDRPSRSDARMTGDNSSEKNLVTHDTQPLGGIMVSQEVSIDIGNGDRGPQTPHSVGSPSRPSSPTKKVSPAIEMRELSQRPQQGMVSMASKEEEEPQTFVDVLFTMTVVKRQM